MPSTHVRVRVLPSGTVVRVRSGELLANAILKVVPQFPLPCGGRGFCGGCAVAVREGAKNLSRPTGNERLHKVVERGLRLACQAKVFGDVSIEVPGPRAIKAVISGVEPAVTLEGPLVRSVSIRTKRPSLAYGEPLDRQLTRAAGASYVSIKALAKMTADLYEEEVKVVVHEDEVVDVVPLSSRILGLAFDVGTTKIAGYLVDLESGSTLAEGYTINPQAVCGDDVVSRIRCVAGNRTKLQEVRQMSVAAMEELAAKLLAKSGSRASDVYALVLVGNAVSLGLALGVDVTPLGESPYAPLVTSPLRGTGRDVGLKSFADASVYVPPAVGSFVGSDAVSFLVTIKAMGFKGVGLGLDIGTNTEVVLINRWEQVYVASAPAGPAIEGGHVSCGVKSFTNAIQRAWIDPESGKVEYWPPLKNPAGLTGAALIGLIADMLRHGFLDERGRLTEKVDRGDGVRRLVIARMNGRKLYLDQRDVRELQKAKAAIAAVCKLLLRNAGISAHELDAVFVAGSFGSSLQPTDAIDVGLIPPVGVERVIVMGNAAGVGAKLMLKNARLRSFAESVPKIAKLIEPAAQESFMEVYMSSLNFERFDT